MEIPFADAKWRCACGNYTGSQQGLRGHQRHRKTPDCTKPPTLVIPESLLPKGEPLRQAAEALWPENPTRPSQEGDPFPGIATPGGEPDDDEFGSVHGRFRGDRDGFRVEEGRSPTMLTERVSLPVIWRTYYDAWVKNLGFEGTFSEWIAQILDHFHELAGFEMAITVAVPTTMTPGMALPRTNGHAQAAPATPAAPQPPR